MEPFNILIWKSKTLAWFSSWFPKVAFGWKNSGEEVQIQNNKCIQFIWMEGFGIYFKYVGLDYSYFWSNWGGFRFSKDQIKIVFERYMYITHTGIIESCNDQDILKIYV